MLSHIFWSIPIDIFCLHPQTNKCRINWQFFTMLFDEPFSHSNYKPFLHIFERFIDNHFYFFSKALILSNSTLHKIFDKRRKIEKLWDYNYRFFPIINNFPFYFFSNKQVHKSQEKFLRKITRQWFIVLMRYMKISELWRNHRKDTFSNFNNHYIFSVSFCFQIQDESENIRKIHT